MNLIVFNLVCNVDPFPVISFHAFSRPKGQFLNLAQNALVRMSDILMKKV